MGDQLTKLMIGYLEQYDSLCKKLKSTSIDVPEFFDSEYLWKSFMQELDKKDWDEVGKQIGTLLHMNYEIGQEKGFLDTEPKEVESPEDIGIERQGLDSFFVSPSKDEPIINFFNNISPQ